MTTKLVKSVRLEKTSHCLSIAFLDMNNEKILDTSFYLLDSEISLFLDCLKGNYEGCIAFQDVSYYLRVNPYGGNMVKLDSYIAHGLNVKESGRYYECYMSFNGKHLAECIEAYIDWAVSNDCRNSVTFDLIAYINPICPHIIVRFESDKVKQSVINLCRSNVDSFIRSLRNFVRGARNQSTRINPMILSIYKEGYQDDLLPSFYVTVREERTNKLVYNGGIIAHYNNTEFQGYSSHT